LRVIVNYHNGVGIVPPNGIVRGNPEFIVTGLSEVSENHKHVGFPSDSKFFGFGMRRLYTGIGGGEGGEERGEFGADGCAEGTGPGQRGSSRCRIINGIALCPSIPSIPSIAIKGKEGSSFRCYGLILFREKHFGSFRPRDRCGRTEPFGDLTQIPPTNRTAIGP